MNQFLFLITTATLGITFTASDGFSEEVNNVHYLKNRLIRRICGSIPGLAGLLTHDIRRFFGVLGS